MATSTTLDRIERRHGNWPAPSDLGAGAHLADAPAFSVFAANLLPKPLLPALFFRHDPLLIKQGVNSFRSKSRSNGNSSLELSEQVLKRNPVADWDF